MIVIAAFAMFAVPVRANSVTPSTNNQNRSNGWAYVNQLSMDLGSTELEFVSTRAFWSCFEYRVDNEPNTVVGDNPNILITDGRWTQVCVNNSSVVKTISANEFVDVRMVYGAEGDERFDWTRFDVIPAISTPVVSGFLNPSLSCDALTKIHSTTVDWTDSTGGVGGISGYQYSIDYPLADGSGTGHWTTFVAQSQYSGGLNEGTHTVKVRAKDYADNYSDWSNSCSITTDWSAPDVELTNPLEGDVVSGNVEIRGSVEDANPHHYWLVIQDSEGHKVWGPNTVNDSNSFTDKLLGNWDTTLVPDGDYTVKLEARDAVDNKDSGSVDWNVVTVMNKPTSKDQCKSDGWMKFGSLEFKNQGQCVSYVQANEHAGKRDE